MSMDYIKVSWIEERFGLKLEGELWIFFILTFIFLTFTFGTYAWWVRRQRQGDKLTRQVSLESSSVDD